MNRFRPNFVVSGCPAFDEVINHTSHISKIVLNKLVTLCYKCVFFLKITRIKLLLVFQDNWDQIWIGNVKLKNLKPCQRFVLNTCIWLLFSKIYAYIQNKYITLNVTIEIMLLSIGKEYIFPVKLYTELLFFDRETKLYTFLYSIYWSRCLLTTVNPETGVKDNTTLEPLTTLNKYSYWNETYSFPRFKKF